MALRGTSFTSSFSLCASVAILLLSGCSANFSPSNSFTPEQTPIGPIHGLVHGGQFGVASAHIYLYAAGTTGYGSASTSLITTSPLPSGVSVDGNGNGYVTTDGSGNFSLSGDYSCTEGTQVYLVAVAGNPGLGGTTTATWSGGKTTSITVTNSLVVGVGVTVTGTGIASGTTVSAVDTTTNVVTLSQKTTSTSGTNVTLSLSSANNPYIVQMAGLGECPSSGSLAQQDPYVVINEISTVAFAYAMAPFEGTDEYHIGSTSTTAGKLAIHNAMANVGYLVNLGYGQPLSTMPGNSNVGMPSDKILHLANILATCVNTSGALKNGNSQQPCYSLFNDTGATFSGTGSATTTTSDEAQAIFYIAQNPTTNVTALYNLVSGTTAFNDTMTGAPTDWTLPIIYKNAVSTFAQTNGSNTNGPFSIAIDASGNAWIGDRINGVIEITTQGALSTWNHSFGMIKGVSIDPSGNIWAADYGSSKVYIMNTAGTISKTLTTGLNGPAFVAFNTAGNAYIVNEGGVTLTVYDSTGSTVLANAVNMNVGNGITTPDFVAIDAYGNAWVPDTGGGTVGRLETNYTTSYENSNSIGDAYWLGFDSSHNMWIGDRSNNWLDTGTSLGNGTYTMGKVNKTNGGVSQPDLGQIDGAGTIWIPDMITPPTHPPSTTASVISAYSPSAASYLATGTAGFSTGCSTSICPNSGGGGTGGAVAAAVDLSGNVWVANEDGTVSELIGLGAPTASPITPSNAGTEP
ncbi:MAG TPA: hypothetical protein VMD97_12785 [Candidatus Aquilonibacter sp.]|nr:hypothetical protein [Candidatus Aquilonibacter sp.]